MSARKLHVSPDLLLPQDVQTSTEVVYGGKGMGKTNFGSVLAEELHSCGLRFSIIDPMGVWWGLRHSANGKGLGIEVLILGGVHGDIPIEPTGGAVVADLVVDEDVNVVIDISRRPDGTMWSIGERVRFVTDYCKRLYQRQGEKRRPLKQIIDEAARFIPQVIRHGDEQVAACMGALAVLVEEGRNVGVGVCLITQRSARLNKDVAELADCMIAFRTVGPNSRRAVLDWLGEHVEKNRLKDLDEKVRSLPLGSALVVSPGWLEYEGIVPMRMRTTFDSSATPKRGEQRRTSGPGAKPDLATYRERMAATIQRAKADDPKELKKRIAELERELKAKPRVAPASAPKVKTKTVTIDRQVITRSQLTSLKESGLQLVKATKELRHAIDWLDNQVVRPFLAVLETPFKDSVKPTLVEKPGRHVERQIATAFIKAQAPLLREAMNLTGGDGQLGKGERICLVAIAQHTDGVTREQLTTLAGYRRSTRDLYVQKLTRIGYVEQRGDTLLATDLGRAAIGPGFEPLPTGSALLQHWRSRLPEGQRRLLDVTVDAYPEAVDRATLGEEAGYRRSTRDLYVQQLIRRKLLDVQGRGQLRASALLFDT